MSIYINNSKNLIPFPYLFSEKTRNGIMSQINKDGSITFTGTATADMYLTIAKYKIEEFPIGTYYLSGGKYSANILLIADAYLNEIWKKNLSWGNGEVTIDFNGYNTVNIFAYVQKGATVNYTMYPMFNEGTEAYPQECYNKLTKVKAYINNSKNLIPFPYDGTTRSSGITFSINSDGTIVANGQNDGTNKSVYYLIRNGLIFPAGTYTVNANIPDGYIYITLVIEGKYYFVTNKNPLSLSFEKSTIISAMYIQVEENAPYIFNNYKFEIMMNKGLTSETYEPYNKLTKVKLYTAKRNSKNLIPFPYAFDSKTSNGITITALKDGQFSIVGTNTANGFTDFQFGTIKNLPVGEYTISCSSVKYVRFMVQKRVNGVFICNYNIG